MEEWKLANVAVAASNLYALRAILRQQHKGQYLDALATGVAMTASLVYHLAETRHSLPGIPPLDSHAHMLLQLDRVFAVSVVALSLRHVFRVLDLSRATWERKGVWGIVPARLHYDAALVPVGLAVLLASEACPWRALYCALHIGWHVMAFHMVYRVSITLT